MPFPRALTGIILRHKKGPWKQLAATFFVGFLVGFVVCGGIHRQTETTSTTTFWKAPSSGFIAHINDIPPRKTSHVDGQGRPITKQQLVEPFVIPTIAGFSVATLLPGQTLAAHSHKSMVEFFYILSGQGTVTVNEQVSQVSPGDFVQAVPGETHGFAVLPTELDGMRMLVCGVAVGPK